VEKEQILDFTRRISQSNRSGLTVINYEIIFWMMQKKHIRKKNGKSLRWLCGKHRIPLVS
jgi:hypothetical protein